MIAKINHWSAYLSGADENYSLEHRFFISAMIFGIITGVIGTLVNVFLMTSLTSVVIPLILLFVLFITYYLTRFRGYFKQLSFPIIIISYVGLSIVWLYDGGINGSDDFVLFIVLILGLIIVSEKQKKYVFLLFISLKSIDYLIQYFRPDLIANFASDKARWFDLYVTSMYVSFLIYLIVTYLHKSYTRERKKVESIKNELELSNTKLKESNETKDKFFSIIAHDLKNPLIGLVGMSDLLLENYGKYDEAKRLEYITMLNKTSTQTFALLENLLEWSKLHTGGLVTNIKKHSLKSIARDVFMLSQELAKSKNIIFQNNVVLESYVACDLEMTKTIFRNLVSNAVKFTHSGGLITVNTFPHPGFIEIQIRDNGIGIASENLLLLFRVGKMNPVLGTDSEGGIGLGLVLCKELIELQGGTISVESELSMGSIFKFTLPLAPR